MSRKKWALRVAKWMLVSLLGGFLSMPAQAQRILAQHVFGGEGYEKAMVMEMAKDGNIILAGHTNGTDGIGEGNHGEFGTDDIFIMKVSPKGHIIWRTILGGSKNDEFVDMVQTSDDGFAIIGNTLSSDGDVEGRHGGYDYWVIKLDQLGQKQWARCYGGTGNDKAGAIAENPDGGYYIGGESGSKNGDIGNNRGGLDIWVAQLDEQGEILKSRVYGGTSYESVRALYPMEKGHLIVMGYTKSNNGNVEGAKGAKDVWVFDISRNFDIAWQTIVGGSDYDDIHDVIRDGRGDFIFAGTTFSSDGDIEENHGGGDFWLFKMEKNGNLVWSKTYGGPKSDGAETVLYDPKDKGSYLLIGQTNSYKDQVKQLYGLYDGWVVKTDTVGNLKWTKNFGGKQFENLYSALNLPNGNYMIAGFAESPDYDLAPVKSRRDNDVWMFELTERPDGKPYGTGAYLAGYVTDRDSGWALNAEVVLSDNSTLKRIKYKNTDPNTGIYTMALPEEAGKYSVMVHAPGYMFYGQDLDMKTANANSELRIDAKLIPLKVGAKLVLEEVQFNIGSWDLREESFPELSRLTYFLGKNTNIKIEIGGHTDNTGNAADKRTLSLKRAEKVRDFLLKGGVPGGNMTVRGYGMEQPIATNDTEEGRQKNRRVEFKVIEIKD